MFDYLVKAKDFKHIFNTFNQNVKIHKAKRIPYSYWAKLKLLKDSKQDIKVWSGTGTPLIIYFQLIEEKKLFSFMYDDIEDFIVLLNFYVDNKEEKKGNDIMFKNFEFGPINSDKIKLSPYGLAVRNAAGNWVSYNSTKGEIFDVDLLNFDATNLIYKMPVAVKDIAVGDIVVHNREPMFVEAIVDNKLEVVDIMCGESKTILPTKSPFGFNFITKVMSVADFSNITANEDEPFGNMLPFMMAMNSDGNPINPMVFWLMGDNKTMWDDPMKMFLCMSMMNGNSDFNNQNLMPLLFMNNCK